MKIIIAKLKNILKEHFYVIILLLLTLLYSHNIISASKVMNNIHYISDVTFYSNNMKEAILEHHTLPLWTPFYYSGRPLYSQPEYFFIDFNLLLILLTGNIILAMNSSVIIHIFLAGLGMYLLVLYLNDSRKAAFISALIYMFNGFVHTFVIPGNIMIIEGYSLIPFIFLFTIKALKSKEFVLNSIIAGLFVAMLVFVGGVIFFPYLFLLLFLYSLVYLFGKNLTKRLTKLVIVCLLISAVGFGVSAIKLLPGIEFINLSNRGVGIPYQEYLGEPIKIKNFGYAFISNVFFTPEHISAAIGIAGFFLLVFGLSKIKNRIVLFSFIAIIVSILLSHESFLTKLLFYVPVFNQLRHVERSISIFAFSSSILAGFGFMKLELFTDAYKKINKNLLFIIVVILVVFELFMIQRFPESVNVWNGKDIPILNYISQDHSKFRVINLVVSDLIGASGYNYYSQLGISDLKGGSGVWFNDYIDYLAVAQYAPAKFWGVLNAKYVIHDKNISMEGLQYITKFERCQENCQVYNAFGPYLYENEKYLPRYYLVPNSVLIVGDKVQVTKLVYNLMLQDWNPENTVLIEGTKINDYDIDFMSKFNYIILSFGSVDQDGIEKLKQYKSQGGVLIPDILNNENTVSNDEIHKFFNSTKGSFKEININDYAPNKVILKVNGDKGWLVASERFAYFPGWTASINGKSIKLFEANNAVSAVYLEGDNGNLIFEYEPSSYKNGKIISVISAIILIFCFGYAFYTNKFKSGDKNKT